MKPFLRYVEARIEHDDREEAYRIFITESLRLAPQGKYLTISYIDLVERRNKEPEKEKTGDEIAEDVITGAGLVFGGEN